VSDHYFTESPTVASSPAEVDVRIWGHRLSLTTDAGVFARGRVDTGTALLFRCVEPPAGGTLLDLGCGYGVIACLLAAAAPTSQVWAVDVNERAVDLTGANARRLGVDDRVHARPPAQVPADLRFDAIWSNPPIRIGKTALHTLLLDWLPRLSPNGIAYLVVARHLGADSLQAWLTQQGYPCTRVGAAKGFRVLAARPARSSR